MIDQFVNLISLFNCIFLLYVQCFDIHYSGRGKSVPRCCVGQDKLCHTHRRLRVNPKRPSPDITNLHFLLVLGFGPSKVDCHSRAIDIAIFFLEPVVLHWRSGNIEGGAPGSEGPDAN